ncbi:MAG TPA: YceI family protein [Acetobacteraceae bacterium]|nr:YceI family protein [Acetobacteraceae bacterium]
MKDRSRLRRHRHALVLWAFALVAWVVPARAAAIYPIDQRFGSIAFSVGNFGLFSSHGEFRRFSGTLSLDLARPGQTRITVVIDANSVSTPWRPAARRLRSPAYFDVTHFRRIHFTSSRVLPAGPHRYQIDGQLEIRGITQPLTLTALLAHLSPGPKPGTEVADFVVTGKIRRFDFGMTADHILISNVVHIMIHAHIALRQNPDGK